jgi:hypothetical protein
LRGSIRIVAAEMRTRGMVLASAMVVQIVMVEGFEKCDFERKTY